MMALHSKEFVSPFIPPIVFNHLF